MLDGSAPCVATYEAQSSRKRRPTPARRSAAVGTASRTRGGAGQSGRHRGRRGRQQRWRGGRACRNSRAGRSRVGVARWGCWCGASVRAFLWAGLGGCRRRDSRGRKSVVPHVMPYGCEPVQRRKRHASKQQHEVQHQQRQPSRLDAPTVRRRSGPAGSSTAGPAFGAM